MAEYIVVRPWFGVKKGQRLEIAKPHPAILPNIRLMSAEVDEEQEDLNEVKHPGLTDPLVLANGLGEGQPDQFDWESVRNELYEELKDSAIEFDETAPASDWAALLDEEVREGIKLSAQ